MFSGFTNRTFEFFMAIRFNNNPEFFQDQHDWYVESVRAPFMALCEALAPTISEIDPALNVTPKRAVARIRRDTRFSRDKTPYRDYLWMSFRRDGEERARKPGFYFDLSDSGASFGFGYYEDNRPVMNALRREILGNAPRLEELLDALGPQYVRHGAQYQRRRVPEAVPQRLREWFLLKGFYMEREINDFELLKSPALAEELARGYRALAPLYRYFVQIGEAEEDVWFASPLPHPSKED